MSDLLSILNNAANLSRQAEPQMKATLRPPEH
jgi:hypothetical protein